jgi:hypothetical protein
MLRSVVLALVIAATGCAPPPNQMGATPALTPAPITPARYEAAPVAEDINFGVPPDLRDRICGDAGDRGGAYATVTKSSNAFCR